MKPAKIAILSLLLLAVLPASAQEVQDAWEKWGPTRKDGVGVIARLGYSMGGTTPLPLPKEVRSINEFRPKGGATVGADVYKMLNPRWGFSVGWHFFYEGFHTSADVKNYRMSLTMEGNTMSGYFTGRNITDTKMWGLLMPVMATWRVSPRWNISAGPYFSMYFKQDFSGEVYDNAQGVGYLRVDTPTGEKVNMDRANPATYDFTPNMRNWNGGVELAFDWKATRHINLFGLLDWGLSNLFEPDFEAVAFKMVPIYGTIGVGYRY